MVYSYYLRAPGARASLDNGSTRGFGVVFITPPIFRTLSCFGAQRFPGLRRFPLEAKASKIAFYGKNLTVSADPPSGVLASNA